MLTPGTVFTIAEEREESAPVIGQDKEALARFSAASPQASPATKPALNTTTNTITPQKHKHSTKRQKIFAGSWIDKETDAYIEHRLQEGRKVDPHLSRSAVIRMMLEERALDETITRQHAILAPLIRETMQAEHRDFENRDIAVKAKIALEVSKIMPFLIAVFSKILPEDIMHEIEVRADTAARVNVTERTQQVEEVVRLLKQGREGGK